MRQFSKQNQLLCKPDDRSLIPGTHDRREKTSKDCSLTSMYICTQTHITYTHTITI